MFTNEVGEYDKTAMSSVLRYFEVSGYPVDELFDQRIMHFPGTKYGATGDEKIYFLMHVPLKHA